LSSLLAAPSSPRASWGAAAVTAAALYALPYAVVAVLASGRWWYAALAVDLLVLLLAAVRLWSPLAVLVAALLGTAAALVAWFAIAAAETCGDSRAAGVVEWLGAALLALPLGAWGVRRGARVLWAVPLGWALAALWIALTAHLVPGGSGPCFE
jgi:hypothetical protein